MSFRRIERLCGWLGVCAFLAGCSGGAGDASETARAKGVVTYRGKPVENLSVAFMPDGKGRPALGKTDAEGKFELMTNKPGDGASIGTHNVAISFIPNENPPDDPTVAYKPPVSPIPAKYADPSTSGLTQTVDKDPAKNDFKFDLKD